MNTSLEYFERSWFTVSTIVGQFKRWFNQPSTSVNSAFHQMLNQQWFYRFVQNHNTASRLIYDSYDDLFEHQTTDVARLAIKLETECRPLSLAFLLNKLREVGAMINEEPSLPNELARPYFEVYNKLRQRFLLDCTPTEKVNVLLLDLYWHLMQMSKHELTPVNIQQILAVYDGLLEPALLADLNQLLSDFGDHFQDVNTADGGFINGHVYHPKYFASLFQDAELLLNGFLLQSQTDEVQLDQVTPNNDKDDKDRGYSLTSLLTTAGGLFKDTSTTLMRQTSAAAKYAIAHPGETVVKMLVASAVYYTTFGNHSGYRNDNNPPSLSFSPPLFNSASTLVVSSAAVMMFGTRSPFPIGLSILSGVNIVNAQLTMFRTTMPDVVTGSVAGGQVDQQYLFWIGGDSNNVELQFVNSSRNVQDSQIEAYTVAFNATLVNVPSKMLIMPTTNNSTAYIYSLITLQANNADIFSVWLSHERNGFNFRYGRTLERLGGHIFGLDLVTDPLEKFAFIIGSYRESLLASPKLYISKVDLVLGTRVFDKALKFDQTEIVHEVAYSGHLHGDNLYITGISGFNVGNPEGFLLVMDKDGNMIRSVLLQEPYYDLIEDSLIDSMGNLWLTGATAAQAELEHRRLFVTKISPTDDVSSWTLDVNFAQTYPRGRILKSLPDGRIALVASLISTASNGETTILTTFTQEGPETNEVQLIGNLGADVDQIFRTSQIRIESSNDVELFGRTNEGGNQLFFGRMTLGNVLQNCPLTSGWVESWVPRSLSYILNASMPTEVAVSITSNAFGPIAQQSTLFNLTRRCDVTLSTTEQPVTSRLTTSEPPKTDDSVDPTVPLVIVLAVVGGSVGLMSLSLCACILAAFYLKAKKKNTASDRQQLEMQTDRNSVIGNYHSVGTIAAMMSHALVGGKYPLLYELTSAEVSAIAEETGFQITETLATGKFTGIISADKGNYGFLVLTKDPSTQHTLAMKVVTGLNRSECKQEGAILQHLTSAKIPGFPKFYDYLNLESKEQEKSASYIIMEFFGWGNGRLFADKLQAMAQKDPIKWPELFSYMFENIVDALAGAHRLKVFHRDVKKENLVISKAGKIALIDVGNGILASSNLITLMPQYVNTKLHVVAKDNNVKHIPENGSCIYFSPQRCQAIANIFNGQQSATYDGGANDVWAVGVMMLEIILGRYPFKPPTMINSQGSYFERFVNSASEAYFQTEIDSVLSELKSYPLAQKFIPIIQRMLVVDEKHRPKMSQVKTELAELSSNQLASTDNHEALFLHLKSLENTTAELTSFVSSIEVHDQYNPHVKDYHSSNVSVVAQLRSSRTSILSEGSYNNDTQEKGQNEIYQPTDGLYQNT